MPTLACDTSTATHTNDPGWTWARWTIAADSATSSSSVTLDSNVTWAVWATGTGEPPPVQRPELRVHWREEGALPDPPPLREDTPGKKALALLRELLDEEQWEDYSKKKYFLVKGQSGKTYRIHRGWAGNVEELDDKGKAVARYCIHPKFSVPVEDSLAVQKLMLELEEERFLGIANRSQPYV